MALTSPSLYVTHGRSSGPSHHRGFCCPVSSSGTTAAPDSHPARPPFPGSSPVIGSDAPTAPHPGNGRAGEGLPGSRCHPLNVPSPIRREVPRGCFQALHPFHGLRRDNRGSAPPVPARRRRPNDAAGFASRYGPLSCSPQRGFRRWASTRPVSRPSRQPATGPPGSYPDGTRTRRRQRAYVGSGQLNQPPPTSWRTLSRTNRSSSTAARRRPTGAIASQMR
jgi:hypothetical protein